MFETTVIKRKSLENILFIRLCIDSEIEHIPTSGPNAEYDVIIMWSKLQGAVSKQSTQAQRAR